MKIHKLSEELISKIAAGEVIERPAYALKELIENALDANARNIKVEIEDAGLRKIAVFDDGEGMDKEDLLESINPHTTSKISSEENLIGIKSLGFRGEALSSIASISHLVIKSRPKQKKHGTKIEISSSKIKNISSVGMPVGTQVKVERLFHSVPVRKKFLKTKQTEYRHLLDTAIKFALSYPHISFSFKNNDKLVFQFNAIESLPMRLEKLLGESVVSNLIPIKFEESYVSIKGFLSRPQLAHYSTQQMQIFINKRPISDLGIVNSIKDAYGNLLENFSYPYIVLFIEVPYEVVDVNIHPRKETIKFVDPLEVYSIIQTSVKQTLEKNNLTFHNLSWKDKNTSTPTANLLKELVLESEVGKIGKIKKDPVVSQIHNLYLIVETKNGVMFIDQHAAHEAILYRRFKEIFLSEKKKNKSMKLKKSILLDFPISDFEVLQKNLSLLNQIGFKTEDFGANTIKVNSVPKILEGFNIKETIKEFIDDLKNESLPKEIDRKTNKMLAYLSCRSAIKAGQHLHEEDIKELLKNLEEEDYIYTCPHGRPVKLEFSLKFLDKIFKRK